jgi:hypothetical protein
VCPDVANHGLADRGLRAPSAETFDILVQAGPDFRRIVLESSRPPSSASWRTRDEVLPVPPGQAAQSRFRMKCAPRRIQGCATSGIQRQFEAQVGTP